MARLSPKTSLYLEESEEQVKSKTGSTLCKTQSRMILLLLISLRKDGQSENEAILQVANTFKIGHEKVRLVNNHWWEHRELYETTAAGRGKTAKKDDRRRCLTEQQEEQLRTYIDDEHKAGRQVFRRTVAEWMHRTCGFEEQPSNRSDGIGRTTGKGLRMIMVHAITKWGPLAKLCDGFPIEEGWFKTKGGGKGKRGGKDFSLEDEETAEFLWQAKLANGDYHAAMTDSMFMEWLERRLSPAYNAVPDFKGKKMILVLDNASYHHGFDVEVKVPETNTKKYNVELLRYDPDDVSPVGDIEDGVGEEIEQESSGWEGGDGNDVIEA
eukprot:g11303.t1